MNTAHEERGWDFVREVRDWMGDAEVLASVAPTGGIVLSWAHGSVPVGLSEIVAAPDLRELAKTAAQILLAQRPAGSPPLARFDQTPDGYALARHARHRARLQAEAEERAARARKAAIQGAGDPLAATLGLLAARVRR